MFPETLAYRDDLAARLGLQKLRIIQPRPEVIANKDETGLRWSYDPDRSEEHTSELQSLMRISYAVFCLQNKKYYHLSRLTCSYISNHYVHFTNLFDCNCLYTTTRQPISTRLH